MSYSQEDEGEVHDSLKHRSWESLGSSTTCSCAPTVFRYNCVFSFNFSLTEFQFHSLWREEEPRLTNFSQFEVTRFSSRT